MREREIYSSLKGHNSFFSNLLDEVNHESFYLKKTYQSINEFDQESVGCQVEIDQLGDTLSQLINQLNRLRPSHNIDKF